MKTKPWSIVFIVLCTICTSLAAILNKQGAVDFSFTIQGTILNFYLIGGLSLLVIGVVFLMLSLKGGEVTVVYPAIATSYIWVTLLSYPIYGEAISATKIAGVLLIIGGVISVNLGGRR
jgi:drug/metabolite transporter (DMT)-like permease